MSEQTNIGWADHTAGPWLTCTEVSPGCAHCYARELMLARMGHIVRKSYRAAGFADWETRAVWGRTAPRVLTKGFWTDVHRWNVLGKVCVQCGQPPRAAGDAADCPCGQVGAVGAVRPANVFPSLIDWLDDMPSGCIDPDGQWIEPIEVLVRFLRVIRECPNLNFLLLTKRSENFFPRLRAAVDWIGAHYSADDSEMVGWIYSWLAGHPPANVWIGFSAENNDCLWKRWGFAKLIPARVTFISIEPLLEDVAGTLETVIVEAQTLRKNLWCIVGGESGSGRRDSGVEAIVNVATVCAAQSVRCFVKQDCAHKSEQQGRIPDDVWAIKQMPELTP